MFLQYIGNNQGVNLSWSSYEIEGTAVTFRSYVIYRGTDSTQLVVVDTIAANLNSYTDKYALSQVYRTYYRIGGILEDGCDPDVKGPKSKKHYNTSISNIENNRLHAKAGDAISNIYDKGFNISIYPNPSNGIFTVGYTLPVRSDVRLVVSDLTGKEIANLIDSKQQSAGEYKIQLNTNEFGGNPGIYFLRLVAVNGITTKKMVVVK
jgi:hypothetical protein